MVAQNDAPKDPSGCKLFSWSGNWDPHFTSLSVNASVSDPFAARRGLNSATRMPPTGRS